MQKTLSEKLRKTVLLFLISRIDSVEPLHRLLHNQRHAMNMTVDAIRWLLQDEIVSELRHIGPVDRSMLEKVEYHVNQSEDHPSCISRHVRLQFVFGAEQSLELFVKEFEKISLPEYVLNETEKYYYLTSFVEKHIAVVSPFALEREANDSGKELQKSLDDQNAAITPKAVADTERKEDNPAILEVETTLDSDSDANEGLLAIYVEKDSESTKQEEINALDTSIGSPAVTVSLQEDTGVDEDRTPPTKHPHLDELGKQHPAQEEADIPAAVTPVKDSSFISSAGSTPVGKLLMPAVDVTSANSSDTAAEDDEGSTGSPLTPRQEEQSAGEVVEEHLQFWLVMRIFDNEVAIFFHRR